MLYFLNLDGTMTLAEPQRVFQGSNNVNTVYVLSAIAPPTALEISFTLPSGLTTAYYPMIYNGATDEYTVPNTTTTVYLRSFLLTSNITAEVGTVGVSVNAVYSNADGTTGNQTSFTGSFNVEYSSIPETVTTGTADELQQALDLLSQYYTQQQAIITGGTNGEYLQSQGNNQLPVWTSFDMDFVTANRAQSFSNAQKSQARTNIGAASQTSLDNDIANCVQIKAQSLTDEQKAQARTNIGAEGSADSQYTVKVIEQTFTEEQKTQARTNIGALSSADLSIWSQRTTGEEDLNALADVGSQKAYISRYGTDTTNKPTTYGNIISFRSSSGDLTQLALAVTTDKIFYRQSSSYSQYGTWKEVLLGLLEKGDNFSLSLSNGFRLQVITDTSGIAVAAGQVVNKPYTFPIAYSSVGQVVGITTNQSGITTSIPRDNSTASTEIYFRNNMTSDITINRVNILVIGY